MPRHGVVNFSDDQEIDGTSVLPLLPPLATNDQAFCHLSCDTVMPPPREIIDEIKDVLDLMRDPEWHLFYRD